jgi:hypothetical protein
MDYLGYWSLLRKPFIFGDDVSFFAGVPQREAIAGLNYFLTSSLNSAILVAPARCGMTWMLRRMKQMQGFGDCAAEVIFTDGNQHHRDCVQAELCAALGYHYTAVDSDDQIGRAIEATARQGIETIWLIDRCATAATRVARDLIISHEKFSVVIGATPEDLGKRAIQFGQSVMQVDLTPLSVEDTAEYVRYSLEHAGCTRQLFPDNTAVRLHEMTGGAIAKLSALAESSLALAASHRMDEVTPAVVEAIDQQISRAA